MVRNSTECVAYIDTWDHGDEMTMRPLRAMPVSVALQQQRFGLTTVAHVTTKGHVTSLILAVTRVYSDVWELSRMILPLTGCVTLKDWAHALLGHLVVVCRWTSSEGVKSRELTQPLISCSMSWAQERACPTPQPWTLPVQCGRPDPRC